MADREGIVRKGNQTTDPIPLTFEEREIILMIMLGYRDAEIASRLSTTTGGFKKRRAELFNKLGVADRLELALYALTHHLYQA